MAHIKHYIMVNEPTAEDAKQTVDWLLDGCSSLSENNWWQIDGVINMATNECTNFDGEIDSSLNEIKQEFIDILKGCPTNEELIGYINAGEFYQAQNAINNRVAYNSALRMCGGNAELFDFDADIFEHNFTKEGFTNYSHGSSRFLVVIDVHV